MSVRNADKSKKTSPCPTCQEPADLGYAPFCSKRCADIDLHRWLSGGYAIPAEDDDGYNDDEGDLTPH